MIDLHIDPPSDFPGVQYREYLVSGDNPTPLISLRGGIIITGLIKLSFCLGLSGSEMGENRWKNPEPATPQQSKDASMN